MAATQVSSNRSFKGFQRVYKHASKSTSCEMTFGVYEPDHEPSEKLPVIFYLSGLTCTHANVMEKGGFQRLASHYRFIFVHPDTSPRGTVVPDEERYDLGQGAGFYLDATQAPWSQHFRMKTYVEEELPVVLSEVVPAAEKSKMGIMGHSMGGHGAITIGLGRPDLFKSISAFAPIANPISADWGRLAFTTYLGIDEKEWEAYDSSKLAANYQGEKRNILVDQGTKDQFLAQLMPEALKSTTAINFNVRMQPEYDHSYYFISTFMEDHFKHHAETLL